MSMISHLQSVQIKQHSSSTRHPSGIIAWHASNLSICQKRIRLKKLLW